MPPPSTPPLRYRPPPRRPPPPLWRRLWQAWEISLDRPWDLVGPACILLLATIGTLFIYSSQLSRGGSQWSMQLVWLSAGAVVYLAIALTDYRILLRLALWVYAAGLGGLVLLLALAELAPQIAQARYGARRWIDLGPVSLQPSELAKVSILVMAAALLARTDGSSRRAMLRVAAEVAAVVAVPIVLILWQPDLGSALVILPMVFALLFVSNLPRRFFAIAAAVIASGLTIVGWDIHNYDKFLRENELSPVRDRGAYQQVSWLPLHDYQRNRILAFVAPDRVDPLGIGWNLRQSLISVGSGGLTGKGWTQGTQAQLGYLPPAVAHNDFIFSVLAEEKGFVGATAVLSLFGILLCNGIRIASLSRDRFGLLLAVGVTALFAVHVFVNIAMTIGLMPIKGLPLPFMSYGGSFVLSCCLLQGIVQSVYRFRRAY